MSLVTVDQIAADKIVGARVRAQRNKLLAACDWTGLPDVNVDGEAWRAYRQALRDVSQQPGFPHEVTWPAPPA